MAIFSKLVKMATRSMPDMISPKGHAVIDYMIAGAFFATAAIFWRQNKRAAVASLVCGGTHLGVSVLTDYPGGVRRGIDFSARRELDLGLAAMTAAMPEFLNFEDEPQRKFFATQGLLITVANELTQFPETSEDEWMERRRAA